MICNADISEFFFWGGWGKGKILTLSVLSHTSLTFFWIRFFRVYRNKNMQCEFDVCLTVHHRYKWRREPTRCHSNNLLIFLLAQHVSGNLTNISHQLYYCSYLIYFIQPTVQSCQPILIYCISIFTGHYTTCCKQSCSSEDG